ncbi:undecaprenyl/decaprenyl-phosphate alpha-N-acetylglucosaminyl 1-phosphate transferase [Streptomyces anulatus]|uniref:undecaprenyl/decaprenyl-phosphate alpha-N-acetylglucosaminyl 1-phosphate transferase n=1 Tax=Streptomyces anulatus TaxID=1892 RepID=UPI002259A45B|nr:undecaprenyl/decaprenyl-phosphate alpha-N-acetylglucosaminyl 1-phosphate transferase [Streptomyces anulatus]MCX4523001.1 undecaprenyl/decaprenyl-phosphate alpha-N-acetylglucosaminyl 1-phosphate transferase [Streptomyces anulatus]WSU77943.1 undecaprenyl/decaprenyl-phosphate alpha-N-acetylglucosaminyl 1-phosphate transferase [Streptomyces anulatus]
MNVLGIIASGVAALFVTVALAKGARRAALRPHAPDEPGGRASRAAVLRRTGGATVVLGVGTAAGGALWLGAADGSAGSVAGLLAGAGIVAALGLVHDLKPFRAALRLPVQTAAAVLVVCLAGLSPAAGVLAVLWIVLVTNAFALLDHADGLLTTVGLVTAAGLLACAALGGDPALTLLPATLVAGLTGFLLHNWHPARLRLGASGAQFTGFALAASGALIQEAAPSGRAAWAALPVLATVALADTALVLISRRRAARSLLRDTDDHIAHRLRRVRVTVPGTAVLLGLWAAVPVTTATLVYAELLHPAFLLLPPAGSVAAVFVLLRIPAYTPPRTAPPRTASRRTTAPTTGGAAIPSAASAPGATGPAPGKGEPSGTARTAAGHPTVPPPPTGRSAAGVAAERS